MPWIHRSENGRTCSFTSLSKRLIKLCSDERPRVADSRYLQHWALSLPRAHVFLIYATRLDSGLMGPVDVLIILSAPGQDPDGAPLFLTAIAPYNSSIQCARQQWVL